MKLVQSLLDSTEILPSCLLTIVAVIDNPSPTPTPGPLVVKNWSNSRGDVLRRNLRAIVADLDDDCISVHSRFDRYPAGGPFSLRFDCITGVADDNWSTPGSTR